MKTERKSKYALALSAAFSLPAADQGSEFVIKAYGPSLGDAQIKPYTASTHQAAAIPLRDLR